MRDFVSACTEALESKYAEAALAEKELWRAETEEYWTRQVWLDVQIRVWLDVQIRVWLDVHMIYLNMFSTITRAKEHTWS